MGVNDLWTLVQPIGRNISIETLSGKTLAIDMSIWLVQIIKAMRDEDGTMIKNAHLTATVSRILKLLYNKIKPIFVFDGKPPEIKNKTIAGKYHHYYHYQVVITDVYINRTPKATRKA